MRRILAVLVVALAVVAPAAASEQRPTLPELERELICPTCHELLAASTSPIAERMRAFIRARIAAGDTKSEIKDKLVAQFGESVLAAGAVGYVAYRWSRGRKLEEEAAVGGQPGRFSLDPELERRLDEELARYDA